MDRVYCIPAPEITRLMGAACAGVDRQDPDFRRFFTRRPILDEHSQFTCLAFCMVYWFIRLDTTDMTLQMDAYVPIGSGFAVSLLPSGRLTGTPWMWKPFRRGGQGLWRQN